MITLKLVGGPRDGMTWEDSSVTTPNVIRVQVIRTSLPGEMTISDIAEIKAAANLEKPEILVDPQDIGLAVYEYREHDAIRDVHLYRWTGKIIPDEG